MTLADDRAPIGVLGLWHLGSTIAAGWLSIGRTVIAVDPDPVRAGSLARGHAPVREPSVDEVLTAAIRDSRLNVSTRLYALAPCQVVFVAHDTAVDEQDRSDLSTLERDLLACVPHLSRGAHIVVSAQTPAGTCKTLRARVKAERPDLELASVPENVRLGEALESYLHPGQVVVGTESDDARDHIAALFQPLGARVVSTDLTTAEFCKHAINAFLGTSVAVANECADLAQHLGADYSIVAAVLRSDPRIGPRGYVTPGVGVSGGTLGRDLRVLDSLSVDIFRYAENLFGTVWRANARRADLFARNLADVAGTGGAVAVLGLTYKPGTSTLRRSLPLSVVGKLLRLGIRVAAHDPMADWFEADKPAGLVIAADPYEAASSADVLTFMTAWPQYQHLDPVRLASAMRGSKVFDPVGAVSSAAGSFASARLEICRSIVAPRAWL